MALQKFYFDMKDSVPIRGRIGKGFALNAEAIDHSKRLAARFSRTGASDGANLIETTLRDAEFIRMHKFFGATVAALNRRRCDDR